MPGSYQQAKPANVQTWRALLCCLLFYVAAFRWSKVLYESSLTNASRLLVLCGYARLVFLGKFEDRFDKYSQRTEVADRVVILSILLLS